MEETVQESLPPDLVAAAKEFKAADEAYRRMIGLKRFEDYEAAWRDFLHRIDRVWKKTKDASLNRPGWQKIQSDIGHLRNTDPLLIYLRHARNTDEHTISPVVREWDPQMKIERRNSSVFLNFNKWDRPLLKISDRGQTYPPPDQHLGRPMSDYQRPGVAQPRIAAELALKFYCDFLNRVIAEVFPESPND